MAIATSIGLKLTGICQATVMILIFSLALEVIRTVGP
jgi:hypothetical protein